MQIIPAIDLISGACVRLTKGDFAAVKHYAADPLPVAQSFEAAGLKRLHLVDLDGAKAGQVKQLAVLERLALNTSLAIDFGGGIRSHADIQAVLDAGARQVNIGSLAVAQPELFFSWLQDFGPLRIILAADVRDEFLMTQAWQEHSAVQLDDFLQRYSAAGGRQVLCTDIKRDGALAGPALELYRRLQAEFPRLQLIASGGISSVADLRQLAALGLDSAIIGKALYENKITLADLKEFLL